MAITLKEIAAMTGVSRPAISMLLNNPETSHLSAEKKKIVHDALLRHGYRPNYAARKLKGASGKLVGIIGPLFTVPVHSALIQELIESLRHHGYRVLLGDHGDDPALELELARDFEMRGVDALMFLRVLDDTMFSKLRVPYVVVNDDRLQYDVCTDFRLGGRIAGEHLLSRGYREIAFVTYRRASGVRRCRGLRDALENAAVPWSEKRVISEEDGALGDLLARAFHDGIRAFFCINDYTACAVAQALWEQGIPVPDQAAVVGFDGLAFTQLQVPPLTTLVQPLSALAESAVELMIRRLDGLDMEHLARLIAPKLHPARSTGVDAPRRAGQEILSNHGMIPATKD